MKIFQKIEDIKRPVKVGEKFLVKCAYKVFENGYIFITPILGNFHYEDNLGQKHYHPDLRFIKYNGLNGNEKLGEIQNKIPAKLHSKHEFQAVTIKESDLKNGYKIDYFILRIYNTHNWQTFSDLTNEEDFKIKHLCKKCPHKGYDLTNEPLVNGVVTCPLHKKRFTYDFKEL
jgi:nitrite reductase/ring-hydroxylating ferredoxin subunit